MDKSKKNKSIDKIDLESDFLKLTSTNNNPFPVDVFEKEVQEFIYELNNNYQAAIDYLGAGILNAVSAVIGNSFKLKVGIGWEEKVNLFSVIIGKPGDGKSHALKSCFQPIIDKDNELFAEYKKCKEEYEANSKGEDIHNLKKPILKKFLISDFTPEALIKNLYYNRKGLTVFVDELSGWLKNFDRYQKSGEGEAYLSMWSGTPILYDRASQESMRIKDPFLGIIGTIQSSILELLFREGRAVNGFAERLLFVYPDEIKPIKWNENKVDERIYKNYGSLISRLIDCTSQIEGSQLIPIDKLAKEYLIEWQNNRPDKFLYEYERSIEIKLQQYVLRFALLLQILSDVSKNKLVEKVEIQAVKNAIKLFNYFHCNAIKVRQEINGRTYWDSLSEMQKDIIKELPKKFTTSEGVKIACKIFDNKPRISERQFKKYLTERKLFKKISHGNYINLLKTEDEEAQ